MFSTNCMRYVEILCLMSLRIISRACWVNISLHTRKRSRNKKCIEIMRLRKTDFNQPILRKFRFSDIFYNCRTAV
jgi:hypothetical protein